MADPVKCTVRLTFQEPTHALSNAVEKSVHLDQIGERWNRLVEKINAANQPGNGVSPYAISDKIRGIGRDLAKLFPEITEKLTSTKADFLILEIDARLVHIPWELLYDMGSGKFLCERFSMGRMPHTTDQEVRVAEKRELDKPFGIWILAEPGKDLADAASEARDICAYVDRQMNSDTETIHADMDIGGISPGKVRERIKDYDFVHFAGHADYNSQHPGQSGWRLKNANFMPADIEGISGVRAMPAMIFSNACQSARTEKWEKRKGQAHTGESFGLANAFMLAGVRHYLGTSWEIRDESGKKFALRFYEHLLSGKAVGEAVRLARLGLTASGTDMSWAAYVLYGDPRTSYFRTQSEGDNWIRLQITVVSAEEGGTRSSSKEADTPAPIRQHLLLAGSLLIMGLMGILMADLFHETRTPPPRQSDHKVESRIFQGKIADRKKRIDELWDKYLGLSGSPRLAASSDDWTSAPLTLATVFESQLSFSEQKREDLAARAIQSELSHHDTAFTLLGRKSFDVVLKELIRGIETGQLRPRLKMPGYLLFIELNCSEEQCAVLMELTESETGRSYYLEERVDTGRSVLSQKEKLSEELLGKLKAIGKTPVQGIISDVSDEEILLNVGADHGVRIGQKFRVADQDAVLEVQGLKGDGRSCVARIREGAVSLEKGEKVKEM